MRSVSNQLYTLIQDLGKDVPLIRWINFTVSLQAESPVNWNQKQSDQKSTMAILYVVFFGILIFLIVMGTIYDWYNTEVKIK